MPQIIFTDNASEMIGFADIFNIIDCNAINTGNDFVNKTFAIGDKPSIG